MSDLNSSPQNSNREKVKKFRVSCIERHRVPATVTAFSPEEAIEKFIDGDHDDDIDIDAFGPSAPDSYETELIDEE